MVNEKGVFMLKDFPIELITGIEKIDLQHMELIARVKTLHESFLNGTNTEKLLETFAYIKCYINEHFSTEENYMTELNYPNHERHFKAHRDFIEDYLNLEQSLKQDGVTPDFSLDFNVRIIEWIKNHVFKEDIIMANFIREKETNFENEKTK